MRNGDASEDDFAAGAKRMDVVAHANANIAQSERILCDQPAISGGDVGRRRELDVRRLASDGADHHSSPLGDGCVVGEGTSGFSGPFMGGANCLVSEPLRGLGRLNVFSGNRCRHAPVFDTLERAANGKGRDDAVGVIQRRDHTVNKCAGCEGPRRIVDERLGRRIYAKRGQSVSHRCLAGCPTRNGLSELRMVRCDRIVQAPLAFTDDDLHSVDRIVVEESGEGADKDRLSTN